MHSDKNEAAFTPYYKVTASCMQGPKQRQVFIVFDRAEAALIELAATVTPEGSTPQATAHQWLHSLAFGFEPYGKNLGITVDRLNELLQNAGVSNSAKTLHSALKKHFPMIVS